MCRQRRQGMIYWEVGWQMSFHNSGVVPSNWILFPSWTVRVQQMFGIISVNNSLTAKKKKNKNKKACVIVWMYTTFQYFSGEPVQCIKERWSSLTFRCDRQNVFFPPLSHRALFTDEAYESVFLVWTDGAGPREAVGNSRHESFLLKSAS